MSPIIPALLLCFLFAAGALSEATPVSATTVCNSTRFPAYCKGVLESEHKTANVHEYGYVLVKKSVSRANRFMNLVNKYLSKSNSKRLTPSAVGAVKDCQLLAQLNVDYLSNAFSALGAANKTLSSSRAHDVQTFLSAAITNMQTCLDGLKSTASTWSLTNGLSLPLAHDTKLFSVSLSLFTKGWVPKKEKGAFMSERKQSGFKEGRLPLKMSETNRRIFEEASGRKLAGEEELMIRDVVTVRKDGNGNFTTIMEAVNASPDNTLDTDGYFLIYITAGVYDECVTIDYNKKNIMMIGDGINQTVITGSRSVGNGWTTFNSATLSVMGSGFVGINMTVRNTAGAIKQQALALLNIADRSTFYKCSFEGYQDTLCAHASRQFYRECDIYGTVDFIFGNAAAVFQNCNIYPRLPIHGQFNAITAQGRTDPSQNTGIALHNCTIRPAEDLAASNSNTQTFLGRPWQQFSRTVFLRSYIHGFLSPLGWSEWDGAFALDTLYYGEFDNTGPGSNVTNRVAWPGFHKMNATEAADFTASSLLFPDNDSDWLSATGVPYFTGLS